MDYWRDKVTIVTGGSSGLGLALSSKLLERGARVVIAARDAERLKAAAASFAKSVNSSCETMATDVTRDEDVEHLVTRTVSQHGRIDAFFHCVGVSDRGESLVTTLPRYRELWELNFLSAARCAQAAAPALVQARGHLVLVGSLASKIASRYLGAYPTSKFPLAAFAQQLRLENASQGLHVLLVCPGPIARSDAGKRYDEQAAGLPESARKPGGGVQLKGIDAGELAVKILAACAARRSELVVPARAKLLCALGQLSPGLGDWLVKKFT